jgi:hypothetical protein
MPRQKDNKINSSLVRKRQRKIFLNMLEITENTVQKAVTGENELSAAKLQSLLRALQWLQETYDGLQEEDFIANQAPGDGEDTKEQKQALKDFAFYQKHGCFPGGQGGSKAPVVDLEKEQKANLEI